MKIYHDEEHIRVIDKELHDLMTSYMVSARESVSQGNEDTESESIFTLLAQLLMQEKGKGDSERTILSNPYAEELAEEGTQKAEEDMFLMREALEERIRNGMDYHHHLTSHKLSAEALNMLDPVT